MRLIRYQTPSYRAFQPFTATFTRAPWSGLEAEIDRLFQTGLADLAATAGPNRLPVDLYEDPQNAYVRAEVPGVAREDISVEVVEGCLNLTVSRRPAGSSADAKPMVALSRSLTLGDEVQADKVSAALEHGVLTVTLPKRAESKPRKVSVAIS
jgi:HSP20 family protein